MNYEAWEKLRKELWEKYRSHYGQATAGTTGANSYVFEHCVLERQLCNKMASIEDLTDNDRDIIQDIDSHATTIIEELYQERLVPIDSVLGEVTCRRCGRLKRGMKVYVVLPSLDKHLYDEVCSTCA